MLYLNDVGLLCSLGVGSQALRSALVTRGAPLPDPSGLFLPHGERLVGLITETLPELPGALAKFDCRNNRLAAAALEQIRPSLDTALACYGSHRVAVVMGTSTSGIAASEDAVRHTLERHGEYPPDYHAMQGVLGGLGEFVAAYLGTAGPVSTVSTACSSSASAFLSARRLIDLGLCDAAIVGGVDTLCEMTLQGFGSLEALAGECSRPFTAQRDGINIGEGAAVFLMTSEPAQVKFMGGAASSDAHHISAPQPDGLGAHEAMALALEDAGLKRGDIDYLNAHGTGTKHNDSMESAAIYRLFGAATPCSSTKAMTGHTLGASGALELGLCWLLLTQLTAWRLPPSLYRGERDEELAPIRLTGRNEYSSEPPKYCMSNSFAFGGSNVSLVIGVADA